MNPLRPDTTILTSAGAGLPLMQPLQAPLVPATGPLGNVFYVDIPPARFVRLGDMALDARVVPETIVSPNEEYVAPLRQPEPPPGLLKRMLARIGFGPPKVAPSVEREKFDFALRHCERFGIAFRNEGYYEYLPERREALIDFFGPELVELLDWGMLRLNVDGHHDRVVLFPVEDVAGEKGRKFFIDIDGLISPGEKNGTGEPPIVFYQEGSPHGLKREARGTKSGAASWMGALRNLGWPMIYAGSVDLFRANVERYRPRIALVSSTELCMGQAIDALYAAKGVDPGIVVGLGGPGAIQEMAGLFDFVGTGEHYLSLPMLLGALSMGIAGDRTRKGRAVAASSMVDGLTADPSSKRAAAEALGKRIYYEPVIPDDLAAELMSLGARRYVMGQNGIYAMEFPIAHDPVDGARMFVRGQSSIFAARANPATMPYEEAVRVWASGGEVGGFPFSAGEYSRIARPIPMDQYEIDVFGAVRYPSKIDGDTGYDFALPAVYAQHGCRSNPAAKRCGICTVRSPNGGRAPTVEQTIKMMKLAVADGKEFFAFNDDNFAQDPEWVGRLTDRVVELGLHKRLKFVVQTKAYGITGGLMHDARVRLQAGFGMGVETLSPARAENVRGIKKVNSGNGAKYVELAVNTIDRLAEHPAPNDSFFMISASPGDTIIHIAEDTLAQLRLMDEMWVRHGYFVRFRYNLYQIPLYGDLVTPQAAGFVRAQSGIADVQAASADMVLGGVRGRFVPFGPCVLNGAAKLYGVFLPKSFVLPPPVQKFIDGATASPSHALDVSAMSHDTTIGDIVMSLRRLLKHVGILPKDELGRLTAIMDQIEPIYDAVKKRHGKDVMSYVEKAALAAMQRHHLGGNGSMTLN